jgi:dipeptidyl-peptidase-4
MTRRLRCAAVLFAALATVPTLAAERRRLELADLAAEPPIIGRGLAGIVWRPGSDSFSFLRRTGPGPRGPADLYLEDAQTGRRELVVEGKLLLVPGENGTTIPLDGYQWSPDGQWLLLSARGDLWRYSLSARALERLTRTPEEEAYPSFSPEGTRVAFVRAGNLHVLDPATRAETALTQDGGEHVFNGRLDWVYEEELASRSGKAYEWSPDGKAIAYIRLDENRVPAHPMVDPLQIPHAVHQPQRYPNPGDPNAIPSVHVVGLDGRELARVGFGPEADLYVVPQLSWTRDARRLAYQVLNRSQSELAVKLLDVAGGTSETLIEERDERWVNVSDFAAGPASRDALPLFLADGRYLWLSERTGFVHLYLGRVGERGQRAVTQGEWLVDKIVGVDARRELVYFTSTKDDVRERRIWRVRLDGSELTRLTPEAGTHDGQLSASGDFVIGSFSNLAQAPVTRLLDADGRLLRVVDAPESRLAEFALATPELVDLKAADGVLLHGLLVKPADLDPSRRYPVLVRVYGGPHAETVRDAFNSVPLFEHYLAQRGILVWHLDNRGSWGRGHAFETAIFKDLGRQELADQLAGLAYLKALPYVDGSRLGINGWSYGGYMTLFALANAPEVWKCGIAGAPVTDWRLYDSIYTERYMRTPKDNPDGYKSAAPLTNAAKVKARLLLIHGTADDNVHLQNTLVFVDALVKAGVPHELQLQPGQKHGFTGKPAQDFLNRAEAEFLEKCL